MSTPAYRLRNSTGGHTPSYHSTPDCRHIVRAEGNVTETDVETAEKHGYDRCVTCFGGQKYATESQTCPMCGTDVFDIPTHVAESH